MQQESTSNLYLERLFIGRPVFVCGTCGAERSGSDPVECGHSYSGYKMRREEPSEGAKKVLRPSAVIELVSEPQGVASVFPGVLAP